MIFFAKDNVSNARQAPCEGKGQIVGLHPFSLDKRPDGTRFRMIGHMTLDPHSAIGFHTHDTDEEIYIAVSGEAVFTDNDKNTYTVKPGDIMMTRQGEAHGLSNDSAQPFKFIAVIVE